MTGSVVDLRSDTVTRPAAGMRAAMMNAEVGDDVLDHDPTTAALERQVADLLGKEAALFFPTGIQANQTALAVHGVPGSEVVLESGAHIFNYEEAAGAALSGLQFQTIPTKDGILTPELVRQAIRPESPYMHSTSLVALENTHNGAGGKILPLENMQGIREVADEAGLPIHLDGARLWHACAATGLSPAEYGSLADTVMVCLSKGLGAPVGSLLAGPKDLMARAWRIRRRLGGGMRQSGILAAAGIFALENHRERLKDDHARARALADGAREFPGVEPMIPDTNIVMLDFPDGGISTGEVLSTLAAEGVLMVPFGPNRLRAVTHLDVDDDGITKALEVLGRVLKSRSG